MTDENNDSDNILEQAARTLGRLAHESIDVDDLLTEVEDYTISEEDIGENPLVLDEDATFKEKSIHFLKIIELFSLAEDIDEILFTVIPFCIERREELISYLQEVDEYEQFEPCIETIETLSGEEIDSLWEYIRTYRTDQAGLTVNQHHVYLIGELLNEEMIVEVDDAISAQLGMDVYRKCMDICDTGLHQVLALKYIEEGKNPNHEKLKSKSFKSIRKGLEDSEPYEQIKDTIDVSLRRGISHGDMLIEPYEKKVTNIGEDKSYTFEEFGEVVTRGVAVAHFVVRFWDLAFLEWAIKETGYHSPK